MTMSGYPHPDAIKKLLELLELQDKLSSEVAELRKSLATKRCRSSSRAWSTAS